MKNETPDFGKRGPQYGNWIPYSLVMVSLVAALALLFAADLTLTLITVLGLDKRLRAAREAFREQLEERIPRLRGLHAFQMKRLSKAFPSLDFTRYHEEWLRLRERLRHKPMRMDDRDDRARS